MKKSIFKKIGGLFLGLAMGLGVAVGVAAGNKGSEVKAADTTVTQSSFSFTQAATVGPNNLNGDSNVTWTAYKGGAGTNPGNYNSGIRLYQAGSGKDYGGYVDVTAKNSKVIKSITVTLTSKSNSTTYKTKVDSGSMSSSSSLKASESFTLSNLSATTVGIYCCGTSSSTRMEIGSISVTYGTTGFNVTYSSYKPDDAIGDVQGMPSSVTGVSTHTVSSSLPTVGGYKCDGWSTERGGSKVYSGGETLSAAATLYPHWVAKNHVDLTADDLDLDLQNHAGGVEPLNPSHSGVTYTVDDTSVATYSGGKFYPQAVGETLVTMTKGEDDDNVYEDGMFVITVTSSISSYAVTWTNTNATVTGSDVIYDGEQETYTITAASGYKLPETLSVSGATGSYSKSAFNAATLTISEATGPVSFSVEGIALANYGIAFSGENYTHTEITGIQEFGSETITLTAAEHYDLPNDIAVYNATKVSYTKSNGQLVISNPTGAVTITVAPVARAHYTISVSGAGAYASHFSYSGHENGIYATESLQVTISPDTSSDDIYVITADDINVVGADKGSYTNNVLTISNPTSIVTITVTPVLKVLESIRIETNPNKTSGYKNGDSLDTTGLVVKAVFNTGEETIPTANLKFSQTKLAVTGTAGTAKSETIYVYYHGKSASFDVSVSPVATGASGWNLVTKTSDLKNGDKVIIAASDYNYAISTTQNSNNRGQAAITKSGSSATFTSEANVQEFTLNVVTGGYEFYTGSGYIYASSSSSNQLKTQTTNNANGVWTISISDNVATITATGSNTRNVMQYNQSSSLFACYASASQKPLCLYKYTEGATKAGVAINATYTAGSYTAGEEIDSSKLTTTLVYNDGTSSSVSGATISPSTYVEGTAEYTVTYSTYSTVIQIADVAPAKQMVGIAIDATNVPKAFVVGGEFSYEGLVVYKVFDNETQELLETGYDVDDDEVDMSTAGTYTVYVTYGDFEAQSYEIEVSDSPIINILDGAAIRGYEGESFDLEIELLNYTGTTSWGFDPASSEYYEIDVTSEDDSGLIASVALKKATTEGLTVEISEENSGAEPVEITINVDADYLTGIEVSSSKSTYTDGEYFDYDSVTVTASYASSAHEEEEIDITDCEVTAVNSRSEEFDLNNPLLIETYTITVEYEGETDYFNISVSMPSNLKVVIKDVADGDATWAKVTSVDDIVSGGEYQFVYEVNGEKRFFNNADEANGFIILDDTNSNTIPSVTLTQMEGGYSIKCNGGTLGGNFIYGKSGSNTIDKGASANAVSFEFLDDGTVEAYSNSTIFVYNKASGNDRFRFYKEGTVIKDGEYQENYPLPYLYKKTVGQGEITYREVDVSSTLYAFIRDTYTCEGGGLSTLSGWDDAFNATLNPAYGSLTDKDKEILVKGVVSGEVEGVTKTSWDKFAGFITHYDIAVASGCTNYLDRAKTNPSRINPIVALDNVDTSVWVISAVVLAGLTAIGGYFFYRKRKEN